MKFNTIRTKTARPNLPLLVLTLNLRYLVSRCVATLTSDKVIPGWRESTPALKFKKDIKIPRHLNGVMSKTTTIYLNIHLCPLDEIKGLLNCQFALTPNTVKPVI